LTNPITVRPVRAEDFPAWRPLWIGYNAFYGYEGATALSLNITHTARGQGVGRALIEAVYQHAHAVGSQCVYWQTHETNVAARRLYDSVAKNSGFVIYQKTL